MDCSRATAAVQAPADGPVLIGEFVRETPGLGEPMQIAPSMDGLLLVTESSRGTVAEVGIDGTVIRRLGQAHELVEPRGVAQCADGRAFVTDGGLHQAVVFDKEGNVLARWGTRGNAEGQFNEPCAIAIHGDHAFIADRGNHRVQQITLDGQFVRAIGERGAGPGQFQHPADVALDEEGNLYVADAGNNRVQKFGADLSFVAAWGEWGPFPGLFDEPSGIAASAGHVHVVDRRNHRVQVLTDEGDLVEAWGVHETTPHEGGGKLHYPDDIAIMPDGQVVICERIEDRCQVFAPRPPGAPPPQPPIYQRQQQTHFGEYLSIDGKLMAIAEPENHFIFIFDISYEEPVIINQFSERGEQFGLLIRTAGLSLDIESNTILAADPDAGRIQQFRMNYEPDGKLRFIPDLTRFAAAWDLDALRERMGDTTTQSPPTWPIEPAAIRRDLRGNLFIVDQRNAAVHVFDREMNFVRTIGGYGREPGRFIRPTDLAFSSDGSEVYVVDSLAPRVSRFTTDGAFLSTWGEESGLIRPFGVSAGFDEFIYVTDAAADAIIKFDESGKRIAAFGQRGGKVDQLWKPRGIAHDPALNRLFISDSGNHRTKGFSPGGEWLVTFGAGGAYTRTKRPREESRE